MAQISYVFRLHISKASPSARGGGKVTTLWRPGPNVLVTPLSIDVHVIRPCFKSQNVSKMFTHGASTAALPMPHGTMQPAGLRMSKERAEGDRPVMLIQLSCRPGRRVYTGPIRAAQRAMNEPTTNACRLGTIPVRNRWAGESPTVAVHMTRI
jgi:hypothetical protein